MRVQKMASIVIGVLLMASCSTTEDVVQENAGNDTPTELSLIEYDQVGLGQLYGAGDEGLKDHLVVVRTEKQWKALKSKMDKVNNVSGKFKHEPIDFSKEMVIACFDEVRPNGGYSMRVKLVTEGADYIEVFCEYKEPQGMSTSVMIQPFEVIKMQKSSKKIIGK